MRWRGVSWPTGTPVVWGLAGLMLATSANVSRGTDLRSGSHTDVGDLIVADQRQLATVSRQVSRLRTSVDALGRASGESELTVEQARADTLASAAGLAPASGPGLRVTLADSPYRLGDPQLPLRTTPSDLVVHQQDLQAVVNALWNGGATAVAVMDQRLVASSAVRCAGNVLILAGRTYGPPFTITAIGSISSLNQGLRDAPDVRTYAQYAELVGLRYDVAELRDVTLPGYDGPLALVHATALPAR